MVYTLLIFPFIKGGISEEIFSLSSAVDKWVLILCNNIETKEKKVLFFF